MFPDSDHEPSVSLQLLLCALSGTTLRSSFGCQYPVLDLGTLPWSGWPAPLSAAMSTHMFPAGCWTVRSDRDSGSRVKDVEVLGEPQIEVLRLVGPQVRAR